jgi:hypothetical protein
MDSTSTYISFPSREISVDHIGRDGPQCTTVHNWFVDTIENGSRELADPEATVGQPEITLMLAACSGVSKGNFKNVHI